MRALVFDLSLPKYCLAKVAGRIPGARAAGFFYGPGSCFALQDVPAPLPPSRDFALLAPSQVGVCGSDLAAVFFKSSVALSSLASLPAVFGHEILAHVVSPPHGSDLREGDRVVVDPFLSCAVRGADPCIRCEAGAYATCLRAGTGPRQGVMLGACASLPGGFCDRMVAHASQLFRVPDSISDSRAVLVEPLTVAVHAVLQNPPAGHERVLVLGGGPIALAVVWALHALYPSVAVTVLALEDYQLHLAQDLGAARTLHPMRGTDNLAHLAAETGSALLQPIIGRPWLADGYDRVIDCVGSPQSVDDSLRCTRPGGTIVLVGCAGEIPKLDLTFVWAKELRLVGTLAYGHDTLPGHTSPRRSFDITLELLQGTDRPIEALVTHRLPLASYGEALEVSLDRKAHQSVKAVLTL